MSGGRGEQRIEVHSRGDRVGKCLDDARRILRFVARHQAEVALDDRQPRIFADRAQHRHVGVALERLAQPALVARAADAIEDHAGDAQSRLERLVAEHQRRDAARGAARVEHQHRGQAEPAGERRVAVAAVGRHAVVKPEIAFDQAGIGAVRVAQESRLDLTGPGQVRIEVAAGAAGGQREPHRVDVVGALLERLHRQAATAQCGAQTDRNRRLARRTMRCGDEPATHRDAQPVALAEAGSASGSRGRKSSTCTPTTVSRNAAATPPMPSSNSGSDGAYGAIWPS